MNKVKIYVLLFVAVLFIENSSAQLLMKTIVNQITTTNSTDEDQMAMHGDSTIAIAFKRGSGSTNADNEIWVAVSNDDGETFSEQQISFPGYVEQRDVSAIGTDTCLIVFYEMKDDSGDWWDITARSYDNGETFNLDSTTTHKSGLFTDNRRKIYSLNSKRLCVSEDACLTWDTIQAFPPVSAYTYDVKVTDKYILCASYSTSGDTIYLHYSNDNGDTFNQLDAFYSDLPNSYAFGIAIDENDFTLVYTHEEVGMYSLNYKNYTTDGKQDEGIIKTSTSMGSGKIGTFRNGDLIATSEDSYWDELHFSNDKGSSWKGLIEIGGDEHLFKNGLFYVLDTETKTGSIKNITIEKWKLSDVPYISSPTNDTAIGAYYSHYYNFNIDAENMWIEDSMNYQFQVASDDDFNNVLINTTKFDYNGGTGGAYISINTYTGVELEGNGNDYFIRVRQYRGEDTTVWSEVVRIELGETAIKNITTIKNKNIEFVQNGRSLSLILNDPKSFINSGIEIFNIAGKRVYRVEISDTKKVYTISNLPSGNYFVKINNEGDMNHSIQKIQILR